MSARNPRSHQGLQPSFGVTEAQVRKWESRLSIAWSQLTGGILTTDGDVLYYNSGLQRLAKGSDDQVLTLASGVPSWATPASGYSDPLTTDGDVLIRDTTTKRLAKGSDDQVLTLASGLPVWATPATQYSDPLTTDGDILIRDTTTKRLAKGSDDQILTLASGLPVWAAAPAGVTDHGALTGLADDDHDQYHNDARGNALYSVLSHGHVEADISDLGTYLPSDTSRDATTDLDDLAGGGEKTHAWGNGAPNQPATYGSVIHLMSSTDVNMQFALSHAADAYWRGNASSTLVGVAWKTFLDSSNVATYALPISGGTLSGDIIISSSNPRFRLVEDDAATDEGQWDIFASADQFRLRALKDDRSAGENAMTVQRTAHLIDSVQFPNGYVDITDEALWFGGTVVMTGSGTYTNIYSPDGTNSIWLGDVNTWINGGTIYLRSEDSTTRWSVTSTDFRPGAANTYDLGTSGFTIKDSWFSGNVNLNSGGSLIQTHNSTGGCIWAPGGAAHYASTSSITGAIRIEIPNDQLSDMMSFTVVVYEYVTRKSFTVQISGYANIDSQSGAWSNVAAYILQDPSSTENYTIRFAHDGDHHLVYIGELADVWAYPQVQVFNFMSGYTTVIANYDDDWDITWRTGSFEQLDETLTDVTIGAGGGGGGPNVTVSTSAASGGGDDGDLWCRV